MHIRPASSADAGAISQLVIDAIQSQLSADFTPQGLALFTGACAPVKVAERIAAGYAYWVAEVEDGNIAGVCALRGTNHLYNLFVRADLHRNGAGRALWEHALAWAREQGVREITVNSSSFAIPVYERLGFAKTGPVYESNGIWATPMTYRVPA